MLDYKLKYERLEAKLKLMFAAQAEYLRDTRDAAARKKYFSVQNEVKEFVEPKKTSQSKINWLAQ